MSRDNEYKKTMYTRSRKSKGWWQIKKNAMTPLRQRRGPIHSLNCNVKHNCIKKEYILTKHKNNKN